MQRPLVSIIIPVYDASAILAETIRSALCQTYPEKEIIVIDDGSKDDSFSIAKGFADFGVQVVKQQNAGAAVARNTGLSLSKGVYIQFLDAGDLISADKIEKQVTSLNTCTNKLAVCNYLQFTHPKELSKEKRPFQQPFIFDSNDPVDFLVRLWGGSGSSNFIQTNCWLVPSALIKKAGVWRPYRCPDDDGEFFTRILLASTGIVYVPGIYNYYRVGDESNQLSQNRNKTYLKNTLLTIDLKFKYLQLKGGHLKLKEAFAKQYLDFAVYNFPAQKVLSGIALRRYKKLGVKVKTPLLGGIMVETLKNTMGWRITRYLQHYIRNKFL